MQDYYKTCGARYAAATAEQKQASRAHWLSVHAQNVASGRDDLIIFSAKILAQYDIVDATRKAGKKYTAPKKHIVLHRSGEFGTKYDTATVYRATAYSYLEYFTACGWKLISYNRYA